MELKVTSMADLKKYSEGSIVQLPSFGEDQPFIARLKRPSMLVLMKCGKIPNTLLSKAQDLYEGGGAQLFANSNDDNTMIEFLEILDIIAEASFVEPSYHELKENGIELTDDQYLFVFQYSQNGVKALESFR